MSFGDYLCSDQKIVAPFGHRAGQLGRGSPPRQQVGDHQRRARCWKALSNLLTQPLDTGPTRDQRGGSEALGTKSRKRLGVAAMVTEQPVGKPVFDEPSGAARTFETVAAAAAQRQRGV